MPKIRGFKADLWTDEDFVELSPYARLLWMGMWNYCCDNGHIADKSKQIKMRVLPTDDVNCAELLRELVKHRRIIRENGVITVPNFTRHQKPDKRYFVTCDLPECVKPDGDSRRETRGGHVEARGDLTVGSKGPRDEVNRSEVNRSDGEATTTGKPASNKGRQLPNDWQPNEAHAAIAAEAGIALAVEVEQFRDHHRAKGTTMKDWDAAFRTWLRNAIKWAKPSPASRPPQRQIAHVSQLETPPDGLTADEYAQWEWEQRQKRGAL